MTELESEIDEERSREFKEAFDLFDKDGNGDISENELGTVMRSLGQNPTHAELALIIKEVDVDGDGEISFPEFLKMMSRKQKDVQIENDIKAAFKIFDTDHNQFLNTKELQAAMEKLGEKVTPEQVQEMMKEADYDGDGQLSCEEFVRVMRAVLIHN
eukprot:TRINITY_DN2558_c0_g1_i1.p1 TRINITY_DN2558_c0_g1~~TRINITY_DN2558_c0_g1_i1.p1  ORF type:complete len:157 (-),score=40.84 TRINITY_DN2558_c0_g1_i1:104-574(-)